MNCRGRLNKTNWLKGALCWKRLGTTDLAGHVAMLQCIIQGRIQNFWKGGAQVKRHLIDGGIPSKRSATIGWRVAHKKILREETSQIAGNGTSRVLFSHYLAPIISLSHTFITLIFPQISNRRQTFTNLANIEVLVLELCDWWLYII